MRLVIPLGVLTFAALLPLGRPFVAELRRRGIGKNIRIDGPESHQAKAGTPTMGGLYFVAGTLAASIVAAIAGYPRALLPVLPMLGFGLLGAYDDIRGLADRKGVGWLARAKFPTQWAMGLALAIVLYLLADSPTVILPLSGRVVPIGLWFVPLTTVALVAFANGVNLADGLDGLAAGTGALTMAALVALLAISGMADLALFGSGLVGALLAFLWLNVHPAQVFMGDLGSQALGAGLAAVAMLSGQWILLPVVGIVFVAEVLSVMIQVGYFKFTKRRYGEGRRIFRMAPLHHHFELGGWDEVQTVARFWIVAAVASAIGVGLGWLP